MYMCFTSGVVHEISSRGLTCGEKRFYPNSQPVRGKWMKLGTLASSATVGWSCAASQGRGIMLGDF
jgi:hypothetical protein